MTSSNNYDIASYDYKHGTSLTRIQAVYKREMAMTEGNGVAGSSVERLKMVAKLMLLSRVDNPIQRFS